MKRVNEKLLKIMKESGMTFTAIAERAGMNRATLYNRLKGVGDYSASEILGLAKALHLSEDERNALFFGEEV